MPSRGSAYGAVGERSSRLRGHRCRGGKLSGRPVLRVRDGQSITELGVAYRHCCGARRRDDEACRKGLMESWELWARSRRGDREGLQQRNPPATRTSHRTGELNAGQTRAVRNRVTPTPALHPRIPNPPPQPSAKMSDVDEMEVDAVGVPADVAFSSEAKGKKLSKANLPVSAQDTLPWCEVLSSIACLFSH